jgi:hypothetical protein
LGDPKVKETAGNLRPRKLTELCADHWVSGETAAFHLVGEERQVFSKPAGESDHFADHFHCDLYANVSDIRGDVIDVGARDDARMDVGHARGIHVDDDGQKVGGAGATGREARRGAPLVPESPSEKDGARLPIGREHRPQKRGGDLHAPTHRFEEVQDEVVVALGPIKC